MSTESEKAQQVTTEHVVMTLISACDAAIAVTAPSYDVSVGRSQFVRAKLKAAIKEGEQWLARQA